METCLIFSLFCELKTINVFSARIFLFAQLRSTDVLFCQIFWFFWVKKYSELTWKFRIKIWIPILFNISVLLDVQAKGPFKYYVIEEVGGWGQKMANFDDLQYCKSSETWVGGPKKVKNLMT